MMISIKVNPLDEFLSPNCPNWSKECFKSQCLKFDLVLGAFLEIRLISAFAFGESDISEEQH